MRFIFKRPCPLQFVVVIITLITSGNSQSILETIREISDAYTALKVEFNCLFSECKTTTESPLFLQCQDKYGRSGTCESSCDTSGTIDDRPNHCILPNKHLGQCCIKENSINNQNGPNECSTQSGLSGTCRPTCGFSSNVKESRCLLPSGQHGDCCPKDSVVFPTATSTLLPWWKRISTTTRPTASIKTTHQIPISDRFWKKRKFFEVDQLGCGLEAKTNSRTKRQSPDRVSYIVGGSNVIIGTHPWFVAVGKIEYSGNINWDCGGSVINDRWVLTSAHCLYGVNKNRIRLLVGGGNLKITGAFENIRIFRFVIHPDYLGSRKDVRNDIALIEALDSLETTPICLQHHDHQVWPKTGSVSLVLGYGYGRSGGHISDTLKEAKVTVVAKSECIESYGKLIRNSHDLFCASGKVIEDTQTNAHPGAVFDSCQGDSGGPMVRFHRDNFRTVYNVVGVIAGGKGCGHQEYPGIYIDLKQHIDWIINTVVS